ncbi:hypothetical protein JMJ77_0014362 [Colletotrichum scovillei]|uniref:Uncharacterized protein n=1 Tax=Colletotrichum scovillei TaxID=1209932 RepID=A0A9P7UAU3_9PEZI|nr:hypothetical protein JMJ77_0014362 [Colletotrichum scovillei]KAG7065893.1 hypothetical protein JMJ78_0012636 [Colletotrichum scovillei]KAG7068494.1 hypothetical protein JMJ76_0008180 [Colletotrichum scovillei]
MYGVTEYTAQEGALMKDPSSMAWPTTPFLACYGPTVYVCSYGSAQLSSCLVKGIFLRSARIASHRIAGGPHTLATPWVHR